MAARLGNTGVGYSRIWPRIESHRCYLRLVSKFPSVRDSAFVSNCISWKSDRQTSDEPNRLSICAVVTYSRSASQSFSPTHHIFNQISRIVPKFSLLPKVSRITRPESHSRRTMLIDVNGQRIYPGRIYRRDSSATPLRERILEFDTRPISRRRDNGPSLIPHCFDHVWNLKRLSIITLPSRERKERKREKSEASFFTSASA